MAADTLWFGLPMLRIHHSNRLEVLLDRLVQVMDRPLADPFAQEIVAVQNLGMARWLAQGLAERTGIAANLRFPLPARLVWELLGCWFDGLPEDSDWDRARLVWRLYAHLPGLLADPAFAEPARYLDGEPRELKTYQLARRVADLFDQYLVYRPDLVLAWEQGGQEKAARGDGGDAQSGWQGHWQARLWRLLAAEIQTPHRAALFARLAEALDQAVPPRLPLPERILVFAPSALPPIYCRVLAGVAGWIPVDLFVLNPCREYWADLADEARQARLRARALARGAPDPSTLLDLGNPLLASWGRGGMAFQDQLIETGGDWLTDFQAPVGDSLLALVQGDILALRDRRTPDPAARTPLDPADDSIQLHACHGRHREVQVLHDRLLRCFETVPGLKPREVIVMAPDIDLYAPHIDAVFAAAPPGRRIPWSIADRRLAAEQPILAAVSGLLGLPSSRLGAAEVLGWLAVPAIGRRFAIPEEGLQRIRAWVAETGIRWGLDGAMRGDLGLPAEDANSWAFGLRRLFLGMALPPGDRLYRGLLPYPDLEGPEAAALGGLQDFLDALAVWRFALARPRPLGDWVVAMNRLLADLFAPDEEEETLLLPLREALDQLGADAAAAGLDAPLCLDILRAELAQVLEAAVPAQRFLTGRVTFCNMVPMRSVPARVLWLLGMNGSEFPRDQRAEGFDLMAAAPRPGDRSRREDDRHLFLEALLSAREGLYISYQGNDQRDNSVKVPSVLVDELLDYARGAFRFQDGCALDDRLLLRHPLQPFSHRYFDGSDVRLFSYRDDWCRAARSMPLPGADCFAPAPLAAPAMTSPADGDGGETGETLELTDLIRFLRLPAEWFLTRALGVRPPDGTEALEEAEPFVLDGLTGWALRQRLLGLAGQGRGGDEARALVRAAGVLPHGAAADLVLDAQAERVERFQAGLAPWLQGPRPPLELDLAVGGLRLVGWLEGLTGAGLVAYRLGRRRGQDLLGLWVRHLVLIYLMREGLVPGGIPINSVLITEQRQGQGGHVLETVRLTPIAEVSGHLANLIALFRQGQREPLPLFPETSLAFAEVGWEDRTRKAWEGGYNDDQGESGLWAVRNTFRGRDPLDQSFETLARRVFGPLLAAIQGEAT
jgi:exodeoxyribonuclease V gamma subunit